MIPILALEKELSVPTALNPSLLQLRCKEVIDPSSAFHESRPSEVKR